MIFLIIGLLLGGAAVMFALQNITTITVTFFTWQFEGSLALIILLAATSGALVISLLTLPREIKRSFQISNLQKQNNKLQNELANKKTEVESEKSKLAANNAYLDNLENTPK